MLTRNTPTTYYFEGDRPSGFDYDLISDFARQNNLRLRIKVAFSLPELLNSLERGEAHLAAAGLTQTPKRDVNLIATEPYLEQHALVVYKSGLERPRQVEDLIGRDLIVVAGSSHHEQLVSLRDSMPELRWREIHAADSLEIMQLVSEEKAELAIVDSLEFQIQQRLYPRLVAAMQLGPRKSIVWYLPRNEHGAALLEQINPFLADASTSGMLAQLKRKHFGGYENASRIGSFTFQRKMREELPQWQPLIEEIAAEYQLDWRLLAAIAYQESHWDPDARSHTGVRGMMMLTRITARELDVEDRTDAQQSLRGGARFFKDLLRRLPPDIEEPDRTSMALAAYNIGMGHLEDARILVQRSGGDPHLWPDVRDQLPKLQDPEFFSTTKYGFAEGAQTVTYVDNIRHYEGVLRLQDVPDNRLRPPIDSAALLPEEMNDWVVPFL